MKVKLKVMSGSHAGKEISVSSDKFLIGRSDQCQLRPKSESVSRRHCILVVRDNKVLVQDLKSRNGTLVNGKPLPTDRAKVLKHGDILKVGKLSFEMVIDHGLGGAKKPEVKDVKDAAARTVNGGGDSRFEDVDISSWLDEADQVDRVRSDGDPRTRQLRLDDPKTSGVSDSDEVSSSDQRSGAGETDTVEGSVKEETKRIGRPPKQAPKKLPKGSVGNKHIDSRDAAGDALKRFFSGR